MFETNWLEMKVEFKLESWIQNGFWPFKTQRNARKLLTEAKFESPYLFQVTGRYFEPENKVFAWAVGEFEIPYEFQTHHLDFKLSHLLPLMNSYLLETHPNFELNHWWSNLSLETCQNKFQMPQSNSNALYSFRTCNILSIFRLFMTSPCNKYPMRVC